MQIEGIGMHLMQVQEPAGSYRKNEYAVLFLLRGDTPGIYEDRIFSRSPRGAALSLRKKYPEILSILVFDDQDESASLEDHSLLYSWYSKTYKAEHKGFRCPFCKDGIVKNTNMHFSGVVKIFLDSVTNPLRMQCDKCGRMFYISKKVS